MARSSWSSLRIRLLILVLVAIIPALGLILSAGLAERQHLTAIARENALRLARLGSVDQERVIAGTRQLLIALSRLPQVRADDGAACSATLGDLLQRYGRMYANLAVLRPNGDVWCSAIPVSQTINFSDRSWF